MTDQKTGRREKQLCSSASIYILGRLKLSLGIWNPKSSSWWHIRWHKFSQASGNPGS